MILPDIGTKDILFIYTSNVNDSKLLIEELIELGYDPVYVSPDSVYYIWNTYDNDKRIDYIERGLYEMGSYVGEDYYHIWYQSTSSILESIINNLEKLENKYK